MRISLEPSYIPMMQKPKCCAVTCLQMILYRNGYGLFDQEELAIEFGVKIGDEDVMAFRETMPRMTRFNHDEGISTLDSVGKVNHFFARNGIGLKAESFKHSAIPSVADFIGKHLKAGNDVWIEYHSQEVYPNEMTNVRIHDGVLEKLDSDAQSVTLIDPKPTRRQRHVVPIGVIDRALSGMFGKELGAVVVKRA